MKQKGLSHIALDALMMLVALILFVGSLTFLKTCGPMEDGDWMTCHWAGQAVMGVSAVMAFLAVVNIFVKNSGIKAGLSLGIIANAVLNALIPGTLIHTCMMPDMHCNAVTKPGVIVLSIVIAVFSIVKLILSVKSIKKETKK